MIKSCKLCLSQTHLCPRCEGPVIVRRLSEVVHAEIFSTSVILCTNPGCENYGEFKLQTVDSIEVYICPDCQKKNPKETVYEPIT